jgi:hypothetical protein
VSPIELHICFQKFNLYFHHVQHLVDLAAFVKPANSAKTSQKSIIAHNTMQSHSTVATTSEHVQLLHRWWVIMIMGCKAMTSTHILPKLSAMQ